MKSHKNQSGGNAGVPCRQTGVIRLVVSSLKCFVNMSKYHLHLHNHVAHKV